MKTLIINIKELLQVRDSSILKVSGAEMAVLPTIKNAYLLIENDCIADFGSMDDLQEDINPEKCIDADLANSVATFENSKNKKYQFSCNSSYIFRL